MDQPSSFSVRQSVSPSVRQSVSQLVIGICNNFLNRPHVSFFFYYFTLLSFYLLCSLLGQVCIQNYSWHKYILLGHLKVFVAFELTCDQVWFRSFKVWIRTDMPLLKQPKYWILETIYYNDLTFQVKTTVMTKSNILTGCF